MYLYRFLLTAILTFWMSNIHAQDKGVVRFFVEVDNGYFEIEINDTLLLKRYKDTLPAGVYEAKVWSPGYVLKRFTFEVLPGQITEKHIEMAKNNDFMQYELDYSKYRNQFHKHLTIPASITLASALSTGIFMVNAYSSKKKINSDLLLYNKSPYTLEIDDLKNNVATNNKKYDRQRIGFYINSGLTLALLGGTIWSYSKFKKTYKEPTYSKKSPFEDKYSLNINPLGCSFAIHL